MATEIEVRQTPQVEKPPSPAAASSDLECPLWMSVQHDLSVDFQWEAWRTGAGDSSDTAPYEGDPAVSARWEELQALVRSNAPFYLESFWAEDLGAGFGDQNVKRKVGGLGSGLLQRSHCTDCAGRGKHDCRRCGSNGAVEHAYCGGLGRVRCFHCHGTGRGQPITRYQHHLGSAPRPYSVEQLCNCCSAGWTPCACRGGSVTCNDCGGSGELACGKCSGTGMFHRVGHFSVMHQIRSFISTTKATPPDLWQQVTNTSFPVLRTRTTLDQAWSAADTKGSELARFQARGTLRLPPPPQPPLRSHSTHVSTAGAGYQTPWFWWFTVAEVRRALHEAPVWSWLVLTLAAIGGWVALHFLHPWIIWYARPLGHTVTSALLWPGWKWALLVAVAWVFRRTMGRSRDPFDLPAFWPYHGRVAWVLGGLYAGAVLPWLAASAIRLIDGVWHG